MPLMLLSQPEFFYALFPIKKARKCTRLRHWLPGQVSGWRRMGFLLICFIGVDIIVINVLFQCVGGPVIKGASPAIDNRACAAAVAY